MRYGALFRVVLRLREGAKVQNYENTSYVGVRHRMRIFISYLHSSEMATYTNL